MDTITNPAIVRFANERSRTSADQWERSYWQAKHDVSVWEASGFANSIPDDDTAIEDGSASDGRFPMTGRHMHDMIRVSYTIIAFCENEDQRFGGRKPIVPITQISVNGR